MKVQVRFRFNLQTGEVEQFIVDDMDSQLNEAEHNLQHDRITNSIANVIARHPHIDELSEPVEPLPLPTTPEPDQEDEIQKDGRLKHE